MESHNIDTAYREAELLLLYLLREKRAFLYRNLHKNLPEDFFLKYHSLLKKRATGYPLQYIIQQIEFFSIKLKVIPGVFIPRPETELLVEELLCFIKKHKEIKILDLGTGTGAILLSLLKEIDKSRGVGMDINPLALSVASQNAILNKIEDKAVFVEGDIFSPDQFTILEKFDIIVSNPPYVSDEEMLDLSTEVKYEPFTALNGGKNGMIYYPYIFKWGNMFLSSDGVLAFEMGKGQWKRISQMAKEYGFTHTYVRKDFNNIERIGIVWR